MKALKVASRALRVVKSAAVAAMVSFGFAAEGFAAMTWETGNYDPASWAPTDASLNVLRGLSGDNAKWSGGKYTETGKPMSQDTATLTDGVVPGATIDYTKVFGVGGSSSIEFTLAEPTTLESIAIFSRWGDGGRDGISVSKIHVKYAGDANYTDLKVPAVTYGNGNNNSSGHLFARLKMEEGGAIATDIVGLFIYFGAQDNNGSGYVEIEAQRLVSGIEVSAATPYGEFSEGGYGLRQDVVAGETYTYTLTQAAYTNVSKSIVRRLKGWTLTKPDGSVEKGNSVSKSIVYEGGKYSLVYEWESEVGNFYVPYPKLDTSPFAYRATITASDLCAASEDIPDFQLLVRVSADTIQGLDWTTFAAGGADIRFADGEGNLLPHEIERWTAGEAAEIWVRMPKFRAGRGVTMYWGAADAATLPAVAATDVWAGDYVGVWHMNGVDAAGKVVDATGNGCDGVPDVAGSCIATNDAVVGTALYVSKEHVTARDYESDYPTTGVKLSVYGWMKLDPSAVKGGECMMNKKTSDGSAYNDSAGGWYFETYNATYIRVRSKGSTVTDSPTIDNLTTDWRMIGFATDGATINLYAGGTLRSTSKSVAMFGVGRPLWLVPVAGTLCDECRIRRDFVSTDRIAAEYGQMRTPGYLTYSPVSTKGGIALEMGLAERGSTAVTLSGAISDLGAGATAVSVRFAYGTDPEALGEGTVIATGLAVGDTFSATAENLEPGVTYSYRFVAVNDAAVPSEYEVKGTFRSATWCYDETATTISNGDWVLSATKNADGELTVTGIDATSSRIALLDFTTGFAEGLSLVKIARDALLECQSLVEVRLPHGLKTLEQGVFARCYSLERVTLPDDLESLGREAFAGDVKLKTVTPFLPDSLVSVGHGVFTGCSLLEGDVTLSNPNLVELTGELGTGISSLGLFLGTKITSFDASASGVTVLPDKAFNNCTALKSVKLPETLVTVGWDAFAGCTALKSVKLPETIRTLYQGVFYKCTALEDLGTMTFASLEYLGKGVFYNTPKLTGKMAFTNPNLVWVDSTQDDLATFWQSGITELDLSESGITSLGKSDIRKCPNLVKVTLPKTLVALNYGATFAEDEALVDVVFNSFPTNLASFTDHFYKTPNLNGNPANYAARVCYPRGDEGWEKFIAENGTFVPYAEATDAQKEGYAEAWPGARRPSGYLTFGPGAAYGNITKWLVPFSTNTGMILFLR